VSVTSTLNTEAGGVKSKYGEYISHKVNFDSSLLETVSAAV